MRYSGQVEPMEIPSKKFTPLGSQFLGMYIMETKSDGGIVMLGQDTWWSKVVCVGPDCTIEVGEKVLMNKYRGENIDFKDGKFVVLSETDALCAEAV